MSWGAKTPVWLILVVLLLCATGCRKPLRPRAYEPVVDDRELEDYRPEDRYPRIKVGSWNLYWFGTPRKRTKPKVRKDLDAMARYIADAGVSVLAVMEVRSDSAGRSRRLEELLRRLEGEWDYRLFKQYKGEDECTGVLWDTSRLTLDRTIELHVDRNPPAWQAYARQVEYTGQDGEPKPLHNRKVYAAFFSTGEGRTDFAVVPLHLIASLEGVLVSRVRRYFEMATIADCVAKQVFSRDEYDVILIGDTNCSIDSLESFTLADGSSASAPRYFRTWGTPPYFRELGGGLKEETILTDPPGTPTGRAESWPLDRAYIPVRQCEFVAASLTIESDVRKYAQDKETFANKLSDHLMIHLSISVMPDDDR